MTRSTRTAAVALGGLLCLTACLSAAAAAKASGTEAKKFPSPVVNEIIKGWNGLAWGAKLDEFKKKFADAKADDKGYWATGKGEEELAGIKVTVDYSFNKKDQLKLVRFQPVDDDDKKNLRTKLIALGVLREGAKPNWQNDGVSFVVAKANEDELAVAFSAKFADPAEKKTPAH